VEHAGRKVAKPAATRVKTRKRTMRWFILFKDQSINRNKH